MTYIGHYQSPLGDILIATDEIGVYGLRIRSIMHQD